MTKGSLCVDRQRLASWSTKIVPRHSNQKYKPGEAARHDFFFSATLFSPGGTHQAHYWFGMLMDCYLEEYDAHPPPMQYALLFMNGDSQLPADEDGMRHINLFTLVAMALYGAVYFYQLYERWTRLKQCHLITLIFLLAYFLQALSVLCEVQHLSRFIGDGKGLRWRHTWFALDFVSAVAQGASELIISFVLIALAFGWTLGLQSQEPVAGALGKLLAGFQRPGQLLRGLRSPAAVLLLVLASAQVVLQARGRAFEEDFNNFHDFEHWPGMALIGMRVALCALFVFALRRSIRLGGEKEVLSFLSRLRLLGCIWFLCFPGVVACATVLPPYRRHQLVAGGAIALQSAALMLLSTLFMQRSEYYKISSLAHVGSVFEGGFRAGRSKKLCVD